MHQSGYRWLGHNHDVQVVGPDHLPPPSKIKQEKTYNTIMHDRNTNNVGRRLLHTSSMPIDLCHAEPWASLERTEKPLH